MNYDSNKKITKKVRRSIQFFPIAAYSILTIGLAVVPHRASAVEKCGDVQTFFNWGCDSSGEEQITPVLIQILNWLAVGVTIAVVGGVIYGAIMYTTSGGNPQQAQKAIGIIRNAFVALIMYFVAWSFLNWLVPGGLFN